jgi:hypothetical protein
MSASRTNLRSSHCNLFSHRNSSQNGDGHSGRADITSDSLFALGHSSSTESDSSYLAIQSKIPTQNAFSSLAMEQYLQQQQLPQLRGPMHMHQATGGGITQNDMNAMNMNMNISGSGSMGVNMSVMNSAQLHPFADPSLVATLLDVMKYQGSANIQGWGGQGHQLPVGDVRLQNGFYSQHTNDDSDQTLQHLQQQSSHTSQNLNVGTAIPPISDTNLDQSVSTMALSPTRAPPALSSSVRRRGSQHQSPLRRHVGSSARQAKSIKGKQPARDEDAASSRSSLRRRKRSPSPPSESEYEISSTSSPIPHSEPPPTDSPRKSGEIFRSKSGDPLLFFVQVDLRNRFQVVQKIKVGLLCVVFARPLRDWVHRKWRADNWKSLTSGLCYFVFQISCVQGFTGWRANGWNASPYSNICR